MFRRVYELAEALLSKSATARIEARRELVEMGPRATAALLDLYYQELADVQMRRARRMRTGGEGLPMPGLIFLPLTAVVLALVFVSSLFIRPSKRREVIVHALAEVGDARSLSVMVDGLAFVSRTRREPLFAGLARLLESAAADTGPPDVSLQGSLAAAVHGVCLSGAMSEAQVRFAVATFNALAAWSASSSLDEVHDVLAHIPQPGEAENRRLYTAAAACYEALWAAKQREEQRATLVRASVGPDEPLLRPAASARQPEDGGRLGRPAER